MGYRSLPPPPKNGFCFEWPAVTEIMRRKAGRPVESRKVHSWLFETAPDRPERLRDMTQQNKMVQPGTVPYEGDNFANYKKNSDSEKKWAISHWSL